MMPCFCFETVWAVMLKLPPGELAVAKIHDGTGAAPPGCVTVCVPSPLSVMFAPPEPVGCTFSSRVQLPPVVV